MRPITCVFDFTKISFLSRSRQNPAQSISATPNGKMDLSPDWIVIRMNAKCQVSVLPNTSPAKSSFAPSAAEPLGAAKLTAGGRSSVGTPNSPPGWLVASLFSAAKGEARAKARVRGRGGAGNGTGSRRRRAAFLFKRCGKSCEAPAPRKEAGAGDTVAHWRFVRSIRVVHRCVHSPARFF